MLFCMGLFLIGVGTYLFTYNHIEAINWPAPLSPTIYVTQPYSISGMVMLVLGIVLTIGALAGSFIKEETKSTT